MIPEVMDKPLFNSPGPPPTQPGGVPPTQPGGHPAHTRIYSFLEEPLPGCASDDHGKSFLEMCRSDQDQLKKPSLEFCSILYGPENLNQERDGLIGELDVPVDLEDSVFLSPGKSASYAISETTAPETIAVTTALPLSRLLCVSSCMLALPLLTLGVTLALDLPSMAATSLTAAIFLSALVLLAALLSIFARKQFLSAPPDSSPLKLPIFSNLGEIQPTVTSTLSQTCTSNINQNTPKLIESSNSPALMIPALVCPDFVRPSLRSNAPPANYGACHSNPPIICRVESA